MQSEEIERDIRRAKLSAWWDKWDTLVCSLLFILIGALMGGAAVSYYEQANTRALTRAHDDELAQFRQLCRNNLDDRDEKVKAAAIAAAAAAQSAAAVAQSVKDGTPPPKPPVKRSPPVDLKDAVNRANAQIRKDAK